MAGSWFRGRTGGKVQNSSAFVQVTGPAPSRFKIARVFEFMTLASAPGSVQPQDIEDRVCQDMQNSQLTSPAWQPG